MTSYYNEIDPYAAAWLRNLIAAGHIAPGDVDERSIVDVRPDDLSGYTQCHFFAGIGGWSYAARLAGWPDDRTIWTGSCPCQPYSVAGKGEGQKDPRHLWPEFFRLIRAKSPAVVMGEQVAAAVGKHWLDGVCTDLESVGYSVGAAVVPACAVDAPHRRDRLWFVADSNASERRADMARRHEHHRSPARRIEGDGDVAERGAITLADAVCGPIREQSGWLSWTSGTGAGIDRDDQQGALAFAQRSGRERRRPSPWHRSAGAIGASGEAGNWIAGADGKARRVEPGIRLLAHGIPARVGKLRAYGNAIVPQVAAEVIGAYLDTERIAA